VVVLVLDYQVDRILLTSCRPVRFCWNVQLVQFYVGHRILSRAVEFAVYHRILILPRNFGVQKLRN